jgi:FKBP-type peptidyl-prolyl cis-trans isomerase
MGGVVTGSAQDAAEGDARKPESFEARFGYAAGYQAGKNLKRSGIPVDLEQFIKAMRDAFDGKESKMSDGEIQTVFTEVQKVSEDVKKKSNQAFLDENGKKEGVKTTASGLQYEIINQGSGASPAATDIVKVHYQGTLIDGTEFDSSYRRNEPASFPLNRVIPGWTEGLQLMKKGAKYRFFVPYDLGYGEKGAEPDIPPYSTLIFEVELIEIGE